MMHSRLKTLGLVFLGLISTAGLSGCDEITGQVNVNSALHILNDKGKTVEIAPGYREGEFRLKDNSKKLEIKIADAQGKKQKFTIMVPSGSIPIESGAFSLSAEQIGQAFDLSGYMEQTTTETAPTQQFQTCTYTQNVYMCEDYWIPGHGPHGGHWERRCGYRYVTRYGNRMVVSHVRTYHVDVNADFVDPTTSEILADFKGSRTDQQVITDQMGPCY